MSGLPLSRRRTPGPRHTRDDALLVGPSAAHPQATQALGKASPAAIPRPARGVAPRLGMALLGASWTWDPSGTRTDAPLARCVPARPSYRGHRVACYPSCSASDTLCCSARCTPSRARRGVRAGGLCYPSTSCGSAGPGLPEDAGWQGLRHHGGGPAVGVEWARGAACTVCTGNVSTLTSCVKNVRTCQIGSSTTIVCR